MDSLEGHQGMYWCSVYIDRMLSAVALDVYCDMNVKKSSSTSETGASSDE